MNANLHLQRATTEVQTSLDNLAKQAKIIAEEQGTLGAVESRLAKLSFDIFKVNGAKKRKHPNDNAAVQAMAVDYQIGSQP